MRPEPLQALWYNYSLRLWKHCFCFTHLLALPKPHALEGRGETAAQLAAVTAYGCVTGCHPDVEVGEHEHYLGLLCVRMVARNPKQRMRPNDQLTVLPAVFGSGCWTKLP